MQGTVCFRPVVAGSGLSRSICYHSGMALSEGDRLRGHQLLDQATRERLPQLYANEEIGLAALALVKFFTPDANWTWYASEFDGEDTFFGLVSGLEVELGYFALSELEEIRGPLGLPIERDLHFEPKTLGDLADMHTTGVALSPEIPEELFPNQLELHFLLFKTYYGVLLGWCILTDVPSEEIDDQLEAAANEWLSTEGGKAYMKRENLAEQSIDYTRVMMDIPPEILARYHIFPGVPIQEILEQDSGEGFLPEEL